MRVYSTTYKQSLYRYTMQKNINYRSDIDGLRAIAVLSVLIFHFNSNWLSGGFLGVDIFFVISGFLITSIIKKQISEGRFSFKDFYTRRIKRILPLFFTVLVVTFIFAVIILMPEDYRNFWRSARYAMQFRANRAFTGADYFDISSEEKPLLHLWSLAIEEQFYFVWPLVLIIMFFIVKRFKDPFLWVFWLSILGIVLSTLLAEISLKNTPSNSYYLLQNRAAELLVGCALALNPYSIHKSIKPYLGFLGTVVLIGSFILFDEKIPFPGVYALIPTIAAALFIFDNETESFYKKFFTNKFIRKIGLWSFSLYLWHWPILAFMRYLNHGTELGLPWIFAAAFLTTVLSILSYYLVENPIRRVKFNFTKSLILIYLIPMILMTCLNMLVKQDNDFASVEQTRWFDRSDEGCWDVISDQCGVGALDSNVKYLLIGDSHAMHLSGMMDEIGKKENIKIDIVASSSCPVYFGYSSKKDINKYCLIVNDYFVDNWQKYDAIIFSQLFYGHLNRLLDRDTNSDYLNDFEKSIAIVTQEIPVVIMSDIPEYDYNPLRATWLQHRKVFGIMFAKRDPLKSNLEANDVMKSLVDRNPNTKYVDFTEYVSVLLNNNELIYRDQNHLNPFGSREIGKMFIQEQILKIDKN